MLRATGLGRQESRLTTMACGVRGTAGVSYRRGMAQMGVFNTARANYQVEMVFREIV